MNGAGAATRKTAHRPRRPAPAGRDAEIAGRVLRHWHEAVPDDRMAHLIKDASRAFLRALQLRLAAHGVSLGHWVFLRVLWQRDKTGATGALTKRELSLEAGVMEPTTFVALRAMAALGYVVLEQAADNRKNVYVRLTPQGRSLEKSLVPLARDVNRVALAGIDEAEVAVARRCLLAMVDNLALDLRSQRR